MNALLKLLFFAALIAGAIWAVWTLGESDVRPMTGGVAPVGAARGNPILNDPEIAQRMDEVFDHVSAEKLGASANGKKFHTWSKWISIIGVFSSISITGIAAFFGVWKPEEKDDSAKKSTRKSSIAIAIMALLTSACPPLSEAATKESTQQFEKTDTLQTAISETRSSIYAGDLQKVEVLDLLDKLELKADR